MTVRYQLVGSTASEISAGVETGVRTGRLEPGAALPPVRALAADLGVSPATVAAAYQALRQRGIVETAGRNGTRIRARPAVVGARRAWQLAVPDGVVDLSSGHPDARLLPRLESVLAQLPPADRDLTVLARADLERDGIDLADAAIGVVGGALDGIERVLTAHLRAGDRVAIEDPGWAALLDLVAALGMTAHPMEIDDDGPTEAGLRRAIAAGAQAVVVTSRAQNPTGGAVSAVRAVALRDILEVHPGLLVIEDDHAAQLSPAALHSLAGVTRHWAFVRSVSKPYGPDLRLAVLAGDAETLARVQGRQRLGTGWVSTILQRTVVGLWTSPQVASVIEVARRSYEERRLALARALTARGLTASGRTGINVWVLVPDETTAVARLRDAGYAVAPGAMFRQITPPGLRITVSALDLTDVDRLADAVALAVTASSSAGYRA